MRKLFCISIFVFLAISGYFISVITSNDEAVFVRYALSAVAGSERDTEWLPSAVPENFRVEDGDIPDRLAAAKMGGGVAGQLTADVLGIQLAAHLASGPGVGLGELDRDITFTYDKIMTGRHGDCADYARVFTGLSSANDTFARIWTMAFNKFGNEGHVFSEFFSREYDKWVFIDSINSFYATDSRTGMPLSVLEFRESLQADLEMQQVELVPVRHERFGFDNQQEALDYYRKGLDRFALLLGNDVFAYDELPWVKVFRPYSRALEQITSLMIGRYAKPLIIRTDTNSEELKDIARVRTVVILLAVILLAAIITMAISVRCLLIRH